ncbi:MAG: cryptochrome/photolyase family protein, partial [Flavobacteriaceae bacterium]|nr:cryptochrome/photolyase family protein [Flavobacteriaceae bacterium]
MKRAAIILPNQLVKNTGHLPADVPIFIVEETLFFNQYNFHKQKLLFHRASMKFYESYLKDLGYEVHYIEARETLSDIRKLIQRLEAEQVSELHVLDPV